MDKIGTVLSHEELKRFLNPCDAHGFLAVAVNWGMVALAFALCARFPHPAAYVAALIVIGGRQLGLGVLMHDCAHHALFRSRRLNEFFGQWLCAAPVLSNLTAYRDIHLRHHAKVGTPEDPDLANYRAYPVTRASFRRKVFRDLTGITGVKALAAFFKGADFLNSGARRGAIVAPLAAQLTLFVILAAFGHPGFYGLWVVSYVTTYMLFARIRQVAEHAAVPELSSTDPRKSTRTTFARWWERLTVAPNHVHYHLEHHLLPRVPPYRLAELNGVLAARGFYDDKTPFARGYGDVLRAVLHGTP
jgi:fatty acid desaturase